ncbi:MAG: tyrosine-type recombinase/integrase [Rikenellaceae bacterium]
MIARFIQYLEVERRYSPLTIRNYRRDVEQFALYVAPSIEEFDPSTVTLQQLREWIISRSESGRVKSSSLNREISSIKSLFRWAQSQGLTTTNPLNGLRALKTEHVLPTFIAKSRMNTLLEECADSSDSDNFTTVRNALIIKFFYSTGLRLSELASLNSESFNHDYSTLKVVGKGNKERIVPIVESLSLQIKSYINKFLPQFICTSHFFPLFLSSKGSQLSTNMIYRIVRKELEKGGVEGKKSPHVLRHTFATHLLSSGADMREIEELLGHSSLQATQIYTHSSIDHLQASYKNSHPRGRDKRTREDKSRK